MAGRWRDPTAFRADPAAAVTTRPTRRQGRALLAVLALVVGLVTAVSYLVEPDDARSFDLFGGSVFLADTVAPVAVDLASGQPTVRLVDASAQVGADQAGDVAVVPLADGTLLVDRRTGEFNLVDATGFVIKKDGGVPLPQRAGSTGVRAVAARDFAFIEQTGPTGSSVYLVGPSTVQSAVAGTAVKPRAFRSLPQPISSSPGSSAAAGNDLWALTGTVSGSDTGTRSVRRLSLPPNSSPGATLTSRTVGTVSGPAAIASTGDTVAVGSRDRITVRTGDTVVRTVGFTAPPGVDTVLPASNSTGRLAFLLHGTTGWSVVSVDRDGTGRRGPSRLADVAVDARLVTPALSEGRLYTTDAGTGELWRIGVDGSAEREPGVGTYPVATQDGREIEAAGFEDAYVIARGPRVVVNSPNHLMAVALFTDGSRAPVQFTKSDAVTVSSGGGAEALTRSRDSNVPDQTTDPGRTNPTPQPISPVNNSIDCTTTSQTPHIPALGAPVPGSRSVLLTWTYPVTDRTDCIPRTYVVSVQLLSGGAPDAPASVTIDGQLGVNLGGLFPSTRYQITVTAYLNGKGTASSPIQITTGPEGPTTPRGVTAAADSSGNWRISWSSCGTQSDGCLPAASWRVVPQFCDDGALSGAPAALEVPADASTTTQPGAQLTGSDALLGRGLRFQVEGIGANGAVGEPSASTPCTRSWSPPAASALRLTASKPGDVAPGDTTSTTLSLDLGGNAVRNAGGVGATVTFTLDGPGGSQTRTANVDGRSSVLTASFGGVRAGATYAASARVSPPGHAEAAVSITAESITTRSQWPDVSLDASCPSSGLLTCALSVKIKNISTAQTGGERFELVDGSALRCGDSSLALRTGDLDQSTWTITRANVSQLDKLYGSCSVSIRLVEASSNSAPLYFGGVLSAPATTSVNLGAAAAASIKSSDFTAEWSAQGGSSAKVDYTGSEDLGALTRDWKSTLYAPDGTVCGTDDAVPDPSFVPAGDCVQPFGDQTTGWKVTLSYADTTDGDRHSVDVDVADGAPPSYQACAPTNVTATWGQSVADGVTVAAEGDLDGCRDFQYALVANDQTSCGTASGAPPQTVQLDCGTPPSDGWKVTVTWTNPNGSSGTADPPVTGDPPAA